MQYWVAQRRGCWGWINREVPVSLRPFWILKSEAIRPTLEVTASTHHQASYAAHTLGQVRMLGIGFALFALASLRTSVRPTWVAGWALFVVPIFG